jgi:hypothetical protein
MPSRSDFQFDQCAVRLVDLSIACEGCGGPESRIEAIVELYIVGHAVTAQASRRDLAETFAAMAPATELSGRIKKAILRGQ